MSIFLDCFKNNGKEYLRIINSSHFKKENGDYSNKRKVIKNLGYLSKFDDGKGDGLLYRLREQFKNKTLYIGMDYEELSQIVQDSPNVIIKNPNDTLDPKNIGYFFIENIFNKLGVSDVIRRHKSDSKIEYDLLGLTKLLVFGRILEPKSKKKTFESKEKYLFPVTVSEDVKEIYKVLDVLNAKCEAIQRRMNTKIKQSSIGRETDVTYYDVTNYFFETSYPDEDIYKLDAEGNLISNDKGKPIIINKGFRKKGVCKKHSGKPIVSMGLFMDCSGIPLSYKLFSGNTHESTGFKEIIVPTLNSKDLGKVILVADNGMYDQGAQKLLVENGNGYIISKSVRESWNTKPKEKNLKSIRNWAMEEEGYNKVFDRNGKLIFKSKSRIYERILKDSEGSITIKEKQVITWDIKYYKKRLHEHSKLTEELEFYKKNPKLLLEKKKKYKKFIKILQIDMETGEVLNPTDVVILLNKKIQKEKEILGYYSIITSETELTDKEIKYKYRGLSKIEDSFRIIKTNLEGRPIFVWTEQHINAHFLICFIALTIIRIMQYKILKHHGKEAFNLEGWEQGITAEKIKEALNTFNSNHIGDGYYQISEIKNEIKMIMEALSIDNELFLPDLSRISGLKDKIVSIAL